MTEDENIRWHHQLNEHKFEQIPGDGEGQGIPVFCVHGVAKSEHDLEAEHTKLRFKESPPLTWPRKAYLELPSFFCLGNTR